MPDPEPKLISDIHGRPASTDGEMLRPRNISQGENFERLWETMPPPWQGLVEACWRQPGRAEAGLLAMHLAPAAKAGRHHGYIGGLMEHTLEVAEISLSLALLPANAGEVRPEIVVAGALIHDLGKTWTYNWDEKGGGCRRSALGRKASHIAVGIQLFNQAIDQLEENGQDIGLPEDEIAHIIHIIKTHHGVPTPPLTLEGLIVQLADSASAGIAVMRQSGSSPIRGVVGGGLGLSSWWGRIVRKGNQNL